jgi:hypothetical protein
MSGGGRIGDAGRRPGSIAARARQGLRRAAREPLAGSQWRRETFTLPREEARAKAREFLTRFPKAAYMTEVESWRVLDGDRIEFTMRRLPSAD